MKLQRGESFQDISEDLRKLTSNFFKRLVDKANTEVPTLAIPYPTVRFGVIKAYGYHFKGEGIVLSADLLSYYGIGYLIEVGTHELVHFVVYHAYGGVRQAHGVEFRQVARWFGCSSSAKIADADVVFRAAALKEGITIVPRLLIHRKRRKNKQHKFEWACSCRRHALTTRTTNRLLREPGCKICATCGEKLTFVQKVS